MITPCYLRKYSALRCFLPNFLVYPSSLPNSDHFWKQRPVTLEIFLCMPDPFFLRRPEKKLKEVNIRNPWELCNKNFFTLGWDGTVLKTYLRKNQLLKYGLHLAQPDMDSPFPYLLVLCVCADWSLCSHNWREQELVYLLYDIIDIIDYELFLVHKSACLLTEVIAIHADF